MLFRVAVSLAIIIGATPIAKAQYGCVPGYVSPGCAPMRYMPAPYYPPPPAVTQPPPSAPARSGEDIDDELSGWCDQVTKPSSIVICADRDLRQMALIRNKIFADAKNILPGDAFKQLLADQTAWVKTYSSSCGIAADGPEPSQPISSTVIDCYKREAQKRIVDLVSRLSQSHTGYRPTSLSSAQSALIDGALHE
ncbi:MAG: hypothetical protein WAV02_18425, partial [Stellaceae bacterium]